MTKNVRDDLKECAQYIVDYEAARGEVPAATVLENALALAHFVLTHSGGEPEMAARDDGDGDAR